MTDTFVVGAEDEAEQAFKEQYPAVYAHMLQYKDPLSKRNKAETGIRYEWYAMQRWGAKYWEDFSKPKLFYADITQNLNFVYCAEYMFCNNTTYFIASSQTEQLQYISHFLNSKLIDWYYRTLSVQLGANAVRMFSIYVLAIPIPRGNETDIYKAYGLSQDEIMFIESN